MVSAFGGVPLMDGRVAAGAAAVLTQLLAAQRVALLAAGHCGAVVDEPGPFVAESAPAGFTVRVDESIRAVGGDMAFAAAVKTSHFSNSGFHVPRLYDSYRQIRTSTFLRSLTGVCTVRDDAGGYLFCSVLFC
jgi:hypothetical protein